MGLKMKEILLTQGKIALVDDDDYEELSKYKWLATEHRGTFYAARGEGPRNNNKRIYMHRQILGLTDPNIHGDHINHDKLDNQMSNLRIATRSQNQHNRMKYAKKSSNYKGVSWEEYRKRWLARIWNNNKRNFIGYFKDEIEAAKAYNKKAEELFGEFALLNEIA